MTMSSRSLTIGELAVGISSYCQALRRLVSQGRDLEAIQRTICWDYLERLHTCLPQSYRSPKDLVLRYQRSQLTAGAQ